MSSFHSISQQNRLKTMSNFTSSTLKCLAIPRLVLLQI